MKGPQLTKKRTQDQKQIFRQYGRNSAGHAVPQTVVVRGGMPLREVTYLVKRLRGELELRQEDRERLAAGVESCLAGRTFKQAFGLSQPAHRPKKDRTFYQATEFLLRRDLGEHSKPACETVANRWDVSEGSVRAAVTKHRNAAEAWIARETADHARSYATIGEEVSDRESALRSLILRVDHEIDPDDAPYLALVGRNKSA